MTQIQMKGKTLNLAFTLQAAISYERMTGKSALDLDQFQDGKLEPIVVLGYCMLAANNAKGDVPDFDIFVREMDFGKDFVSFSNGIAEEIRRYFAPQTGDEKPEEGDQPKND